MAEKPQVRIADQDHFSDEDPFAELTRIMGFDPREPVRREPEEEPEAALGASDSSGGQSDGDDFSIDLEKELMGEFAEEDAGEPDPHFFEPADEAFAAPQAPAYEHDTAAYEAAEPVAADDEQVAFNDFEPADFEPVTAETVAGEAQAFDSAIATSIEEELSLDGDWVAAEEEGTPSEAAGYEQPVDQNADASAYQRPQMFDTPPQDDFTADGDWEMVDEGQAVTPDDGLTDDFDAALAEIDMDFTAVPLASAGGAQVELDDELQHRLQEDVIEAAGPEAEAPVDAGQSDAGQSLEDELNALLGNMSGRPAPAAAETVEDQNRLAEQDVAADERQDDLERTLSDDDFAADASDPVEATMEEFPADHSYARSNYRAEDVAYASPVTEAASVETRAVDSSQDADVDIDLDFDEEAFDAAFTDSIDREQPTAFDSEPVADEEVQEGSGADADPYADLASLTAQFVPTGPVDSWQQQASLPDQMAGQYEEAAYDASGDGQGAAAAYDDLPDIETVEVPEQAVALSDDLDIPEVPYQDEPAPAYDDIDAEFASLLNDMNSPEPSSVASPSEAAYGDDLAAAEAPHYATDSLYPAIVAAGGAAYGQSQPVATARNDFGDEGFTDATAHAGYGQQIADDLAYDPDFDEDMELPAYEAEQARQQPQRRGMLIAAIVGGVAIIGGIGAYALAGGGADSQTPAVVRADDAPIKVRPENPGGAKVPNQDNQVYDAVSRTAGATPQPQQEKLVTTIEEPVDVAAQEPEPSEPELAQDADTSVPMAKSEDRIEQLLDEDGVGANAAVPVVTPRKVRTMIVKADGTLVPREDPTPKAAAAADASGGTASETMIDPDVATTLSSESTAAVPSTASAEPVPAEAGAAPAVAQTPQSSSTPNSVAVAPTRPSEQPVDVVGEVKADKVAALAPAAANGAWSMQIASQPSEAAAQSSYQDLLRRYGSVLNGHQANIVKADIAGKGTFWRVRIPAETRSDAIKLCESYKSAGGNCFVSK